MEQKGINLGGGWKGSVEDGMQGEINNTKLSK